MKTAQQHAQEILPLVTAQANGEVIQMYVDDEWYDCKAPTAFVDGCKYRVKPKTILVNGFEVPEPMREEPEVGSVCFVASINNPAFFYSIYWETISCNKTALSRGLIHSTKSAAIAHAKAMLGIDPNEQKTKAKMQN